VKYFLFVLCLMLFVPLAFAGPCLPGTLQDYIFLGSGGCTLNTVQFQDFFLGPPASFATEIDPALIQITPSGGAFAQTLLLTFNSSANSGEVFQSIFHYSALANPLTGASIGLGSPTVTGDGAITGILDVCAGGLFLGVEPIGCTGTPGTAIAFAIETDAQLSSGLSFAPTSFFDVFVDITIDGGLSGSAFLDSAAVTQTTPEPATLLLVGLTLGILGTVKLRRPRRH